MNEHDFEHVRQVLEPFDLRTAPRQLVETLPLPGVAKSFLTDVGLPSREIFTGMGFDLVGALPRPAEVFADEPFQFGSSWDGTRMLSRIYDGGFYINLADAGSIWLADLTSPAAPLFVNTDVIALGCFLAAFASLQLPPLAATETERIRAFADLRARLEAVDGEALDDDGANYWPLIFEDAERFW